MLDKLLTPSQRYQLKNLRRYYHTFKNCLLDLELRKLWHMASRRAYARIKGYPTGIAIEVNNTCNLNCVFCWSRKNITRPIGVMKKEDVFKIIDDASPYISWMCPYFQGEPLLHPNIVEIVEHANKKGLMTEISTNAMLLNEAMSRKLINAKLDSIVLSFDGATKENYEKNRRGANFERVTNNIRTLSKLRKAMRSRRPHILIQMIVTKDNAHEVEAFKELSKSMGVDEIFIRNLSLANTTQEQEREAIQDLMVEGTYEIEDGKIVEHSNKICKTRVPIVMQDGEVGVCCFDFNAKYSFGNAIKQHIIHDIWNSKRYTDFRNHQMKHMMLDICKQCRSSYREIPTEQ